MKSFHQYNRIITHHRPGLDEIAAIFLLKRHAAEWGINNETLVEFMANGDFENPPMSELKGVLYVGCGLGSWANEHYCDEIDKSACYLVARELRLDRQRYLSLVEEVTREDRYGAGGIKSHLAQAIKDLYDMGWNFSRVYAWVKTALVALTDWNARPEKFSLNTETCARSIEKAFGKESACRWFTVVEESRQWSKKKLNHAQGYLRDKAGFFVPVETYRGTLTAFIPDEIQKNPRVNAAARSRGADIVLMRSRLDFGETGIVLQQKSGANLSFSLVLEELRKHELIARGEANWRKIMHCSSDGTVEACPVWHGHQAATGQNNCFAIYNRSKSRPCGPQTALHWEYIVDLVTTTLKTAPQGEVVAGMDKFLAGGSDLNRVFEQG